MPEVEHLNRNNYKETVLTEGTDVAVMIYTTEVVHDIQRHIALQFNIVSDALKRLKLTDHVKVYGYDVNVNAFPEGVEYTNDLP